MDAVPQAAPVMVVQELRIVDAEGRTRIELSAGSGTPRVVLLTAAGRPTATITLDAQDHPSVVLADPAGVAPGVRLEIDDKGSHVRFDRPGGGAAWFFLNDQGESGLVLVDQGGSRRYEQLAGAMPSAKAPAATNP